MPSSLNFPPCFNVPAESVPAPTLQAYTNTVATMLITTDHESNNTVLVTATMHGKPLADCV